MTSKRNTSWADKHAIHMEKANAYEHNIHKEARQFDRNELPNYRKWYQMNGMASVYLFGMVSRDEHGKGGYIPSGPLIIRIALRGIGELAHGVAMFFTKGWRRVGKTNMRRGWEFCCDSGFKDRARALMDQTSVPDNWEDVSSNESTELGVNPYPPPPIFELPDPFQSWLYDGTGWRNYMKQAEVPLVVDPAQVTQDQHAQEPADIIIPSLAQGIFVGLHVSVAYDIHRGNDPKNMETQTQPEVAQDEEFDRRPTQRLRREVHSSDRFSHS